MKSLNGNSFSYFLFGFFLLMLPLAEAAAFVDPPTFSPAQPQAGQAIQMSVRSGGCHSFAAPPPGYPQIEVQVSGDVIDVIIAGTEAYNSALCIFAIGTASFDIGSFSSGNYTVRVKIRQVNPPFNVLPPASEANLTVSHRVAEPVVVPSSSVTGLAMLAGIMVLLAIVAIKRTSGIFGAFLISLLFFSPGRVDAQENGAYVFVEISPGNGAPTPEQVVEDFDLGSGLPPPISALTVENPDFLEYLIPREYRAQGDFKDYLEGNPDLPRARLERTIIVRYPVASSLSNALAALLADPHVRFCLNKPS